MTQSDTHLIPSSATATRHSDEPTGRRGRMERRGTNKSVRRIEREGGHYKPLSEHAIDQIIDTAFEILSTIGASEASPSVVDLVTRHGGQVNAEGRLLFPRALVQSCLDVLPRKILLAGQRPEHDLILHGTHVYTGTGGAAPLILDSETDLTRPTTLKDLYDAARLIDSLDHFHFFSRSLVARDMTSPFDLAINTAFASLTGTSKHVMVSADQPDQVTAIAKMCYWIAGSEFAFRERPFLSLNINHVTPPLRLAEDAFAVMAQAISCGIPIHVNTFGQMGASSPVTIAGCLAQTTAETLAGLVVAALHDPNAKAIMGMRPMVTDLRTGGMAGGGGEQALLMAASTQIAQRLHLPNSCIAGASDSKIPDAQSGFEKSLTIGLAAHAGSNLITQAGGMQAGLMSCSFESYVIDNDMLGAILSSLTPITIDADTLALEDIADVVRGEGHFLGRPHTLARMTSDFVYPSISDRRSIQEWELDGAYDIRHKAKLQVREKLATHYPNHIDPDLLTRIRTHFDIKLPEEAMRVS